MSSDGLNFLDALEPRIVMFCGKGGVGKTTCASTTALHFALSGKRTLLISTDPSPSLSDMFETDLMGNTRTVTSTGLDAVELDYDMIVELWKERFGEEVYDVVSSFLPVERDVIEYIAGAPGIGDEFALSYVYDLYVSGAYDVIVWDTAPAGGTLSLLKLEDTFYRHLGEAARLFVKVRSALNALTQGKPRDPLKIIGEWQKLAQDVLSMVKDDKTMALMVTIPEALSVNQTKRVAGELERFGVHIGGLIINQVLTEEASDSPFNRSRREMQIRHIGELEDAFAGKVPQVRLPLQSFEVRGVETLRKVERLLFPR
jgi:arsenite-transporting ATPase